MLQDRRLVRPSMHCCQHTLQTRLARLQALTGWHAATILAAQAREATIMSAMVEAGIATANLT